MNYCCNSDNNKITNEHEKFKQLFDCVMKQLFESYNEDYLCWKEEKDEYILKWVNECQACYFGCCEDPNCN